MVKKDKIINKESKMRKKEIKKEKSEKKSSENIEEVNCIMVHGSNDNEKESLNGKSENERHWKLWLKKELEKRAILVSNELYPRDWNPHYAGWKRVFEKNKINEGTILIGHSAGCAFILRWLSETNKKVKKIIFVAPYILDSGEDERLRDFVDFKISPNINNLYGELTVFVDLNDDKAILSGVDLARRNLGAKVIVLKDKGHFTFGDMGTEEFPELLTEVLDGGKEEKKSEEKVDFASIEKKWQAAWEKEKVFEANADSKRKKFFINFPYPYLNAYLHLGHAFSATRTDVMARYKRMEGFNVLFPQAWHCTGTPVSAAAQRIKEKEPKQIKIMKDMGFLDSDIRKFEKIEYWNDIFVPAAEVDFKRLGAGVDWRRSFITTELNPKYDKFIQWQFRHLEKKGLIVKGKHPMVWCPKDNMPVGDHDRVEGEGFTTQDFIWGKFRMKNSDLIAMAGTTRPDAFYGQTNLWIDPKGKYVVLQVKDEKWIVGKEVVDKIKNQYEENIKVIREITPKEIIGKIYQGPVVDYEIMALPAEFIDSSIGSGIVYSALEDPVDLFELKKIQSNLKLIKEYGLNEEGVKNLKPIYILTVSGMGENLGEDIGKEFGVKSSKDVELLEKAKGELNKRVFRKGVMRECCGECAGMSVPDCQKLLKAKLVDKNEAVMFYELEGKVICRCLTPCIIKITSDQWFLKYGDKKWKELAHKCLDNMRLYPDLIRQQFNYVLDWLNDWACTHHHGLGTHLPWDKKWVIESLSDSTIYMAYYTIAHLIKDLPEKEIDDRFFDYVFLGEGKEDKKFNEAKKEFEYWYPFDIRSTAKDLVQNHMSFCIFNHTAIFPEKYWPRGFAVNGWLLVNGEKMSKSKGNFFTIRQMLGKYPADIIRTALMMGGEGLDDPNFDFTNAESIKQKLEQWYGFAITHLKKANKKELSSSDNLFLHKINKSLKEGSTAMAETMFRTGFERLFFQMQRAFKDYLNRGEINQELVNEFIEIQTKVLSPFTPHITEELWHKLGNKTFLSLEKWPVCDETKINDKLEQEEKNVEKTVSDIVNVMNIIKQKSGKEPSKVYVYTIPNEFDNYNPEVLGKKLGKEVFIFKVNDKDKYDPENKAGKTKPGKPALYLE